MTTLHDESAVRDDDLPRFAGFLPAHVRTAAPAVTMDGMAHVGRVYRWLLQASGRSIRDVATAAGVAPSTLSVQLKTEYVTLRHDSATAVLEQLGRSPEDLWDLVAVAWDGSRLADTRLKALEDIRELSQDELFELLGYIRAIRRLRPPDSGAPPAPAPTQAPDEPEQTPETAPPTTGPLPSPETHRGARILDPELTPPPGEKASDKAEPPDQRQQGA
jgi:lambda repressor-like predicted transcriptional regulator